MYIYIFVFIYHIPLRILPIIGEFHCFKGSSAYSLSQWLTCKVLRIPYLVRKMQFETSMSWLFGWVSLCFVTLCLLLIHCGWAHKTDICWDYWYFVSSRSHCLCNLRRFTVPMVVGSMHSCVQCGGRFNHHSVHDFSSRRLMAASRFLHAVVWHTADL